MAEITIKATASPTRKLRQVRQSWLCSFILISLEPPRLAHYIAHLGKVMLFLRRGKRDR